jgi:6-phosphogluconolactonase
MQRSLLVSLFLFVSLFGYAQNNFIMYVGTYTTGESKGIYAYKYDASSGQLKDLGLAAATTNPSFLAATRDRKFLYAVNETGNYQGASTGGVSAFTIHRGDGKLTFLNEVASGGADPCYISFDRTGKFALVANYTGGTVSSFPLSGDGRIGEAVTVIKDAGEVGPRKDRQEGPHAHWIEVSARDRFAYVADLGLDRVLVYKFDSASGKLTPGATSKEDGAFSAKAAPATGPRHVAFSADGNFMYVLGEMDSTVTVFHNDKNEVFRSVQKISALPKGFSGNNDAAEIVMHPNGKFLYTSNRGDDSIAIFAVDKSTGQLTSVGHVSVQGKTPRNFAIDPTGKHLVVANQDTNNIAVFNLDPATGRLTPNGQNVKVPSPVCVIFVEQ